MRKMSKLKKWELDLLHEFYDGYDELFDYLRKVKINARQVRDHGSHAAFDLNLRCGGIVKCGGKTYLDELAQDNGFDSVNKFWEYLNNYQSRSKRLKKLLHELYLDIESEV